MLIKAGPEEPTAYARTARKVATTRIVMDSWRLASALVPASHGAIYRRYYIIKRTPTNKSYVPTRPHMYQITNSDRR
jgi:hypothetical protein